ncbi:rhodanese-like domain-containing protein [Arenibacter latericius]|uniref:rhodanese-like domain-containing protein n=1 Tax=Arenibacter latericius TaxID=86104 RepID=UPI00041FF5A8|nr:rhodanese-like domain-containing protein [Arenibacter latericius]MDX1363722.1 rhodanese-like domain-containing protein [Arenibacter latericius]
MKILLPLAAFFICYFNSHGQQDIENTLQKLNKHSVPYITNDELNLQPHFILLDARGNQEYAVSRLPGAVWIGYKDFNASKIQDLIPNKNTPIVVYCSIGVRSEKIGEKLIKLGYSQVLNLYGGIFDWKNKGNLVYNSKGHATDSVHVYNKHWGNLLTNGKKAYNKDEF